MPLPVYPRSFLHLASCAMRLPAAASCCTAPRTTHHATRTLLPAAASAACLRCLPPLQSFHALLAPPSRNRHPEHAPALTPARCVPPATLSHTLFKGPFALRRRAAEPEPLQRVSPGTALQGPTSLTSTHVPHLPTSKRPHINNAQNERPTFSVKLNGPSFGSRSRSPLPAAICGTDVSTLLGSC
jgi:hypothetical protein